MSKKGENIHKRKDGRWEARYKKGRNQNGGIYYGYVYGKTYSEAKEKLLDAQINNGMKVCAAKGKTFADASVLWLSNNKLRLKGGTINKYETIINTHILPQLGGYKLSQITSTLLNSYLSEKLKNGRLDGKGGLSPNYVNSIRIVINAIIQFAVREQLMLPLKSNINKPYTSKTDLKILSVDSQRKLENELILNIDNTKIGILLSLHAGLRIGEVCALRWEDIDLKSRIIHVRHTVSRIKDEGANSGSGSKLIIDTPKTKSSKRDIPISSWLYPYIKQLENCSKSVFLITDNNLFLSPRTYEYRYHKILDECGIESVNYHTLRHTFATRCIEAGVDVKSLSEILGHSNVGITLNTYVHSSMELKRTQIEKLNAFAV